MALFGKKESATLKIQGMHCANCQKTVGDALRKVPGVTQANVDLVFHRAMVTYDPEKTSPEQLAAAVNATGYKAQPAT